MSVRTFPEDRYPVLRTANGTVKKTELSAYANPRVGGIIGINIDEGDKVLAVRETDGSKDILLATAKGFAVRFPESDVRPMGRATYGVRGITLREGDRVVGMEALDPHGEILTVTERGYGKRTPIEDYRKQSRGGMGIINLKVTPKTGEVVGAPLRDRQRRPDADHPGRDDHPHQRLRRARSWAARPRGSGS